MTDALLRDQACAELRLTTDSYPAWVKKGKPASSHWAKAFALLAQITGPPAPIPQITTPFLPTSKVNTAIPANPPIHPDTALMIQNNPDWVIPTGDPAYPYREWIGPRADAFYSRIVAATTPTVTVHVNYDDVRGPGCDRHIVTLPLPALIQQAFTAGTLANKNGYGWIVDEHGNAWEPCYLTPPGVPPATAGCDPNRWNALRVDYWPAIETAGNGYGTSYGCSASHIQTGAGLIRPEDIGGATLGHVLKIKGNLGADGSTAGHPKAVGLGTASDGRISGARGIPYGARLQLDPSIDVTAWPSVIAKAEPYRTTMIAILRTLQTYGASVTDSGGWLRGSGGLDAADPVSVQPFVFPWQQAGYGWGYDNGIPYDLMPRFRVIDWNKWT
jgi:hypothetical protein